MRAPIRGLVVVAVLACCFALAYVAIEAGSAMVTALAAVIGAITGLVAVLLRGPSS